MFEAGCQPLSAIVRNLPFYDHTTAVEFRGRSIPVKHDQIIVWVSLSEMGQRQLDPNAPRLPAVLDTGCNHAFVIRQRHLVEWAGIHSQYLRRLRPTRAYGVSVPQLAANIWLHPNRPGHRDEFSDQPPFLLGTEQGIAVIPQSADQGNPRLPLLGLRAIRWNHLHLTIDGDHCRVNIRTRRRFWIFG